MSEIESLMHEHRIFHPPESFVKNAAVSGMDAYHALCAEAEKDYEGFWGRLARETRNCHSPSPQYWTNPRHHSTNGSKMAS